MRQLIQVETDPHTARQSKEGKQLAEMCEANSSSWVNLVGFVMEIIGENKNKVQLITETADTIRKLGSLGEGPTAAVKVDEISTIELVKSFMSILTTSSANANKNNFKYMS